MRRGFTVPGNSDLPAPRGNPRASVFQRTAPVFQSAALDFQSAALDFQSAALEIQKQALKTLSQALLARPAGPESEESFTNVLLPLPFALPLQA